MTVKISRYAERLTGQPMFKLLAQIKAMEAAGQHIIHFEIGDPDFPTPRVVVNSCIAALAEGGNTHYSESQGLLELRQEIASYHSKLNGMYMPLKASQIVIAPGCNPLIYCIMQCLLNEQDAICMEDLAFPTYESVARILNLIVIKSGAYVVPHSPKLIIINTPQNPSGKMATLEGLQLTYNAAEEMNAMILSDEIYQLVSYDGPAPSMLRVDPELKRTVIISGFSKAFAMTGWRLGYMIAPEWLAEKVTLALQTIVSCTNTFTQKAAVSIFKSWPVEVAEQLILLRERRDILVAGLNEIPGIECEVPDGAFYVFPSIKGTKRTSSEICETFLQHKVACLPGTDFGAAGEGFIRLSYCTSKENIREGLKRMKEALV